MPSRTPIPPPANNRRSTIVGAGVVFVCLLGISLMLFVMSSLLEGAASELFGSPLQWLRGVDTESALNTLSQAAETVASVLGIAITVVAIVVELAANRYSHRITWLFLTEPVNIVVMSLFTVTAVQCIWVAATLGPAQLAAPLPNAGFAITMLMVSLSLLILLPYFAFVFQILSPLNVIQRLRVTGSKAIRNRGRRSVLADQERAEASIDELMNVARRAVEQSDRAVAMACVDALADLLLDYDSVRATLRPEWLKVPASIAQDPDFVALAPEALEHIERDGMWFEVKIFRQYLSLMAQCVIQARDVASLVAIRTEAIGSRAGLVRRPLLDLCIRCFNSYLRSAINARDARTTYYIFNQYRILAEALLEHGQNDSVNEIAQHFRSYGQMSFHQGQPFMLEVTAHDLLQLIEAGVAVSSAAVDGLLDVLLNLDLEIRSEAQESSLLPVRRAQLQAAALFQSRGDSARVARICADLATEQPERLQRIRNILETENRSQYWEFTDRGVNFSYLAPERRPHLAAVFDRLAGRIPTLA